MVLIEELLQLVEGSVYVYVNENVPIPDTVGLKIAETLFVIPEPDQVPPLGLYPVKLNELDEIQVT